MDQMEKRLGANKPRPKSSAAARHVFKVKNIYKWLDYIKLLLHKSRVHVRHAHVLKKPEKEFYIIADVHVRHAHALSLDTSVA